MSSKKIDVFKIEKGYGLVVNLRNNVICYFKNNAPATALHWPINDSTKLVLDIVVICNVAQLKTFMHMLQSMFCEKNRHFHIRELKITSPDMIACYYE